jgi:SAM-dependent methyltransferase
MSESRSFDRAAHFYDDTRPLLGPIAEFGIPAILELLGPSPRVLEAGAGTGRMSIPLLQGGVDLVGCDVSSQMLTRFQGKYPSARIAQADASMLPFPTAHFNAVLTVHVMHLIPVWRETLREFKRVLAPGGVYLNVRTWASVGVSAADQMRDFWRGWLAKNGVDAGHPGLRSNADLLEELDKLGADVSEVEVVRYSDSFILNEELERFESRSYSETWDIPDAIYDASMKELRAWVQNEFGDLAQEITNDVRIVIHVARFRN